jgi:glutamate dehydrogenase/leucine dehydrogenase
MTRKNALAGIWWGGGKGILARTADIESRPELLAASPERDRLFEAYGEFIASLGGIYYTAEDFGTTTRDMNSILTKNRFVTCIAPELGGSGNPSHLTARGVLQSIKASWMFLEEKRSLEGVHVALQGVGNVGGRLARLLAAEGARLTIADPFQEAVDKIVAEIPGTRVVDGDAIFDAEADVLAPCARGAQISEKTIPRLKVKLVCGAANNILDQPERDARALQERGILFVPDYVANRMGIVNCADEWSGKPLEEDLDRKIQDVYDDTLELLERAARSGETTTAAAEAWADQKAEQEHPLFGHRGHRLIQRLLASGWAG